MNALNVHPPVHAFLTHIPRACLFLACLCLRQAMDEAGEWQINEAVDSEQALTKLKAVRGNYNVIIVDESVGSDSLRGHEFIQVSVALLTRLA